MKDRAKQPLLSYVIDIASNLTTLEHSLAPFSSVPQYFFSAREGITFSRGKKCKGFLLRRP